MDAALWNSVTNVLEIIQHAAAIEILGMNVVWFKKIFVSPTMKVTKSLAAKDVLFVYVYEDEIISSESMLPAITDF